MNPLDYLSDCVMWSLVGLLVGFALGLIFANVRDLWRDQ